MYYQEKKTIASIISWILILAVYIIYGISKYQEFGANLLNDLKFWAVAMLIFISSGVIIAILIQIIFHIMIAVANEIVKEVSNKARSEGRSETYEELDIVEVEDEMDKLIALKAMRNSYVVVGVGFVIALMTLIMKMPPAIMLNTIFISFILGPLLDGFSQLYFYRKGIRNV
jgi:magnesium-transporting ATPase (P-type)